MIRLSMLLAFAGMLSAPAWAEFKIHSKEDYESGQFKSGVQYLFQAGRFNTRVISYDSIQDVDLKQGIAGEVCGDYGIEFSTSPSQRFLSVVSPTKLNRELLGDNGAALFQADIFVPAGVSASHSAAVATFNDTDDKPIETGASIWNLYRLGSVENSKAYFSFTDGGASAKIYLHEDIKTSEDLSGGWHRFQLLFVGQEEIYCYIDGIQTTFSPIIDGSLTNLRPGFFISSPQNAPFKVYADNLTIMWSKNAQTPVPAPPWITDEEKVEASSVEWLVDPIIAQRKSYESGKPLLYLFCNPSSVGYQELTNNIFRSNDEAQTLLSEFILLRVDINEKRGQQMARDMSIDRVPSILVQGTNDEEKARFTMDSNPTWNEISDPLKQTLN